jgi:hypothetical protein
MGAEGLDYIFQRVLIAASLPAGQAKDLYIEGG